MISSAKDGGFADRFLGWVGDDAPATLGSKALAFRRIVFLHLVAESWFRYAMEVPHSLWSLGFALVFTMCLGLGWFEKWNRSARVSTSCASSGVASPISLAESRQSHR